MKLPINSQDTARTVASRLTLSNLQHTASLSKVDKSDLVQSYVQSQQRYRHHFESEGLQFWNDLQHQSVEHETYGDTAAMQAGFVTPVLKPRVPEPKATERKPDSNNKSNKKATKKRKEDGPQAAGAGDEQDAPTVARKTGKDEVGSKPRSTRELTGTLDNFVAKSKRKRAGDEALNKSCEPDRAPLLEQRRERRRTKKAIVEAKEVHVNDGPSEKENKKKPKKTGDISTGLALMHGFSATNVGPSRLTVKPVFGVFSKGKASAKTRIAEVERKINRKSNVWTEARFLNASVGKTKLGDCDESEAEPARQYDDSVSNNSDNPPSPPTKKRRVDVTTHASPEDETSVRPDAGSADKTSSGLPNGGVQQDLQEPACERSNPAESVVWDIESQGASDKDDPAPRPASHAHVSGAAIPRNEGTLVLNTLTTTWNAIDSSTVPCRSSVGELQEPSNHVQEAYCEQLHTTMRTSSPGHSSLCPSQSASQVMNPTIGPGNPKFLCRSKYFDNQLQLHTEAVGGVFDYGAASDANEEAGSYQVDPTSYQGAMSTQAGAYPAPNLGSGNGGGGSICSFSPIPDVPAHAHSLYDIDSLCEPWPGAGCIYNEPAHLEACDMRDFSGLAAFPALQTTVGMNLDSGGDLDYFSTAGLDNVPDFDCDLAPAEVTHDGLFVPAFWETLPPASSYLGHPMRNDHMDDASDFRAVDLGGGLLLDMDGNSGSALPSDVFLEEQAQDELIDHADPAKSLESFSRGRALLGAVAAGDPSTTSSEVSEPRVFGSLKVPTMSQVEEDVAKNLRGHWLPQRL